MAGMCRRIWVWILVGAIGTEEELTRRRLRGHAVVVAVRAVLSLVEGELVLEFGVELGTLRAGDEPLGVVLVFRSNKEAPHVGLWDVMLEVLGG